MDEDEEKEEEEEKKEKRKRKEEEEEEEEEVAAGEYCWEMTQAVGRSRCGRSNSSVMEFHRTLIYLTAFLK